MTTTTRNVSGYVPFTVLPTVMVGLYVALPEGRVPERLLQENAWLVHHGRNGRLGLLHPAFTDTDRRSFQVITFEPWCSWDGILGAQLVFRRQASVDIVAGRQSERKVIIFDRPKSGPYRFVRLDFLYRTKWFVPVTLRVRQDDGVHFVRISGEVRRGLPHVLVEEVAEGEAPFQLR